jgi:succinate dehydrogenase/fumarate reductase flavoprotein subunit
LEKDAGERTIAWLDKLRNSNGSLSTSHIRLNMQRTMQNNAAVFRTQETLEEGTPIYYCFACYKSKTHKVMFSVMPCDIVRRTSLFPLSGTSYDTIMVY